MDCSGRCPALDERSGNICCEHGDEEGREHEAEKRSREKGIDLNLPEDKGCPSPASRTCLHNRAAGKGNKATWWGTEGLPSQSFQKAGLCSPSGQRHCPDCGCCLGQAGPVDTWPAAPSQACSGQSLITRVGGPCPYREPGNKGARVGRLGKDGVHYMPCPQASHHL